ncbi:DUF5320 domain-containing protein [Pseudobacteroides cellulosolvens]|uniref:DUF5320 domain-containing protein n=1 Tax=Pseudobacteroides cellulosolvens ATCC 35603 = DSM 2933 TaxID=398512 RepID=A0A0L6JVK7_9FIRM|nr:DUF5320 domain-containing protein [Pseudobacteroides cellulosolvens]KNY29467.1 hypothetical protein Bccel_4741 [Pseudobacteroides cellulosolvens ATCC 35603 = DSM 2933]
MPRGDGTGPMGIGPMTGRGAGNCVGYASVGSANRGVGFGRGIGSGRGFRRMFCLTGMPGWARTGYSPAMPGAQAIDEKTALKNQEDFLEKQLQQVKERLKDFDEQK